MTEALAMKTARPRKPLGHRVWFKIVLAALFFAPAVVETGYDPASTTQLIATVLGRPMTLSAPMLLPVAKGLLLLVAIVPFFVRGNTSRIVLGYYALALIVTGVFQNMSFTDDYGFAWLLGNTLVEFVVAGYCLADVVRGRSVISQAVMNRGRLWLLVPMAVALLFPYNFASIQQEQVVHPDFGLALLYNDAGVTYCMITPVILGIMVIFSRGVESGLLSIVSFAAAGFGAFNMVTWFVLQPQSWWMGVLHLPLVVIAVYGLVVARKARITGQPT